MEKDNSQVARLALVIKTNEGGMWIIPQIKEMIRRGYCVSVIIPRGNGRLARALVQMEATEDALQIKPVDYDFTFGPNPSTIAGLWKLRQVLAAIRPQIVFYHLYASALAVRLSTLGFESLYKVHMVAGPLYLEHSTIRLVERLLCRLDSVIIAGSRYTKQKYQELGMPVHRLEAIPYGVDVEHFRAGIVDSSTARDSLKLPQDAFVVVMVAYVYAPKSLVYPGVGIKGHDTLLDAWSGFNERYPESRLLLVGSGFDDAGEDHRAKLREKAEKLNINESITWLDSVEDVRTAYSAADLSVSPSLSENHGALLEASAMGVPSIVSDAGALPEAVGADTGWIFPRGNAEKLEHQLATAISEWKSQVLMNRGQRAREFIESYFALENCVELVVDVLDRGRRE